MGHPQLPALEWARYDLAGRILFQVNRMASHAVHLIIANSRVAAEEMAQAGYPRPRMMVIPNGTDVERFRPQVELGRDLRKEWGIPAESKLIGMAARLDPMKDHATFVRAAQILALRRSDVHFVCVGEGLGLTRSAALATIGQAALGSRLQWRGQVRDMPSFYSTLDLLASSSAFGESFSNVVAEAMSCGVPCVVTDVGDSRDIVGDTGLVGPPRGTPTHSRLRGTKCSGEWGHHCRLPAASVLSGSSASNAWWRRPSALCTISDPWRLGCHACQLERAPTEPANDSGRQLQEDVFACTYSRLNGHPPVPAT